MGRKKPDFTEIAFRVFKQAVGEPIPDKKEKEPLPPKAAAGRQGGLKGGKARAKVLTKQQRHEIARKAAT